MCSQYCWVSSARVDRTLTNPFTRLPFVRWLLSAAVHLSSRLKAPRADKEVTIHAQNIMKNLPPKRTIYIVISLSSPYLAYCMYYPTTNHLTFWRMISRFVSNFLFKTFYVMEFCLRYSLNENANEYKDPIKTAAIKGLSRALSCGVVGRDLENTMGPPESWWINFRVGRKSVTTCQLPHGGANSGQRNWHIRSSIRTRNVLPSRREPIHAVVWRDRRPLARNPDRQHSGTDLTFNDTTRPCPQTSEVAHTREPTDIVCKL